MWILKTPISNGLAPIFRRMVLRMRGVIERSEMRPEHFWSTVFVDRNLHSTWSSLMRRRFLGLQNLTLHGMLSGIMLSCWNFSRSSLRPGVSSIFQPTLENSISILIDSRPRTHCVRSRLERFQKIFEMNAFIQRGAWWLAEFNKRQQTIRSTQFDAEEESPVHSAVCVIDFLVKLSDIVVLRDFLAPHAL